MQGLSGHSGGERISNNFSDTLSHLVDTSRQHTMLIYSSIMWVKIQRRHRFGGGTCHKNLHPFQM